MGAIERGSSIESQIFGEAAAEMPKYQCHKRVSALKIARVTAEDPKAFMIVPENTDYAPFRVSSEFVGKHNPKPGGYYVVYEDGYESYSPAKAFEEGYTLIK